MIDAKDGKFLSRLMGDCYRVCSVTVVRRQKGSYSGITLWWWKPDDAHAVAVNVLGMKDGNIDHAVRHLGHIAANLRKLKGAVDNGDVSVRRYEFVEQFRERIDGAFEILKKVRDER